MEYDEFTLEDQEWLDSALETRPTNSSSGLNKDEDWFSSSQANLVAFFPTTPLVALLSTDNERFYGPFQNGQEAADWLGEQVVGVHLRFVPLRNPYISRSSDDFYNPHKELDETEYDHTRRETWQQYE